MTVSFNLSQLANSVNSSGLLSLGTGVTSTLPVANGGTASSTAANARTALSAAGSGAVGSSALTMATARLLGRTTASTGAIEELTVGSGLTLSAGSLSATGIVDTSSVLTALSGLTAGAIGTFAFLGNTGATTYSFGDTAAAANLQPSNSNNSVNGSVSGTWRCLGYCPAIDEGAVYATLFIRIS